MQHLTSDVNATTGLRNGTFGIGTFSDGRRQFPALVRADGSTIDLSSQYRDTHEIFDNWSVNFNRLRDVSDRSPASFQFTDLRPLAALAHPNLLCAGANYKTHVAQMLTKNKFNQHNRLPNESDEDFYKRNYEMMERRSREGTPFFWTGLHSSLVGATDDIVLPVLGDEPDWELELAAVIGGHARYASVEEARALIAGYVILNDLGTVDVFRRTDIPWGYDWISKHQPTFKPLGPFIVPAAFVPLQSADVRIKLSVNGSVMQDWPVSDMVFDTAQFIAYASERVNLMPGDVLSTGSPPGNGRHHGRFLRPGDIIDSEITFLGRQRNRCVAEKRPDRPLTFGHWKNATP
jgi:2-keto-4-pentenoate hydratase/2-oxohepta-3-ene-1,7-dioic acid hydratase in catechol pathway